MDSNELRERLDPKHLNAEEIKEEVAEKAEMLQQKESPAKEDTDPKAQREYSFDFGWKDANGKIWRGRFTNTVPDLRTRQLIGALRSQLGNNLPIDSLDLLTQEMNLVMAHLSFSLTARPKWADDLSALFDFRLVQAIYEEVAAHEATFLGPEPATEDGRTQS